MEHKETFIGLAALAVFVLVADAGAQPCDVCASTATAAAGVVLACPRGDGDALSATGVTITVTVKDCFGVPVPDVPATDIWLIGCNDQLALCGGAGAINATGPTDANGQTTIAGAIAAGGCDVGGIRVVAQGIVLEAGVCGVPCIPIQVKSCDITGDLVVNLSDLSAFGAGFPSPPKSFNACIDYRAPFGTVELMDFAAWAQHFDHDC